MTFIKINATPRTRGSARDSDLYVVRVFAENKVRFEGTEEFVYTPMSKMLISYLNKFSEDLKLEFLQGIRKF